MLWGTQDATNSNSKLEAPKPPEKKPPEQPATTFRYTENYFDCASFDQLVTLKVVCDLAKFRHMFKSHEFKLKLI